MRRLEFQILKFKEEHKKGGESKTPKNCYLFLARMEQEGGELFSMGARIYRGDIPQGARIYFKF